MEGVGARLGRSSTRYGPATVFSGPVRKWKKMWVPLSNPNSAAAAAAAAATAAAAANGGTATNNNHSHLVLYKWTPISSRGNGSAAAPAATGKDASAAAQPEEPPRRKFRYVPVSVIEEQKQEAAVKLEEENKPSDADPSAQAVQSDQSDGKPDMNDASMEEAQAINKDEAPAEDNKGTDLNLSLGLNAPDGDGESNPKLAEQGDSTGQPERVNSGEDVEMKSGTNSETDNKLKRKAVTPDLEMRV
ncbi:uncharacterized protein [Elaeis guineensis]|uniref:Uncharacterized protein LOC105039505 n=1 Tax=Elaeis guineensis var. tenera TaxID=51953 RepID=A0A6I9QRM5_ELAGV|nr:uncharacterized protein LOC105039505 [Elaeis guineensis]